MPNSDTTHNTPAPLTEEQLAEIERYWISEADRRMPYIYLTTTQKKIAQVVAEVRSQRTRIAELERVVEAAKDVADDNRWDDMHEAIDGGWEEVFAPTAKDIRALRDALAALEAPGNAG